MKKAFLQLANEMVFEGRSVGFEGTSIGEIVFNTGMTGYQEILTDPSYFGQIVCMTYPLIGNCGVNEEDNESGKSRVRGFIVREMSEIASNFRTTDTLDSFLKKQQIVGLAGIDTRRLTRVLRNAGTMNGILYTEGFEPDAADIAKMKSYGVKDAVSSVTRGKPVFFPAKTVAEYHVGILDFGIKRNIEQELCTRGCDVTILPADTDPAAILASGYDGLMLSNGPGDPAENTAIIENLKVLIETGLPIFGICLGHQLLALANGFQTEKMKFGHRGVNHPVVNADRSHTYITSQNHGYAVVRDSVDPEKADVLFSNLNDGTVEGLLYKHHPIFSVQFHPEVSPGPKDTCGLFDRFLKNMDLAKGGDR